jgi:hypothetical protein
MHRLALYSAVCAIRLKQADSYDKQIKEMFEGGNDNLLNSGSNLDVSQDDIYTFSGMLTDGETMAQVKQQA